MRKTIVLLLSVAVILGCMAVPVSAAKGFESRIINRYVTSEFHGITMKKYTVTFDYSANGRAKVSIGFKKSGDNTLYGGKRTTIQSNTNNWKRQTMTSNFVDSSIGANTPFFQIKIF